MDAKLLKDASEACYELYEVEEGKESNGFTAVTTICKDPGEQGNGYWQVVVRHTESGKLFAQTFCCHSEWGIIDDASEKQAQEVIPKEVKIVTYVPVKE